MKYNYHFNYYEISIVIKKQMIKPLDLLKDCYIL